jgi:hypothetical protein
MSRPLLRLLAAAALMLAPSLAFAQGAPVFQSGLVTPGHVTKSAGNGLQMDAGGLTGDVNGRGVSPFSITDSLGLGLCSHTAATGGQHYEFCLGHDSSGNALLSATANGGATEKSIYFSKNGTLYEIPFTGAGGGNMVGPNASTVDNASCWNNTSGSLTRDCGGPPQLSVANNTALKALIGTHIASVRRNGFSSAGDGGAVRYIWSAVNCTAADDGAQVQPSGTGCWIADFSSTEPNPMIWGAVGDGVTDDTTKVQAAITAMANTAGSTPQHRLRIVGHYYCVTALTIPTAVTLEGAGPPVSVLDSNSGLKACASNASLITIAGNGVRLHNLVLNGQGGNTSGFAIKITGHENRIESNHVNGFCTYVYNIGRHNIVMGNVFTDNVNPSNSAGCDVIVDGDATAQTIGSVYMNNVLTTWGPSAAGAYHSGMLFQNSGGPYIAFNDIQRTGFGTILKPLAGKRVAFVFFENTVLGDTTNNDGLLIDTTDAASHVEIVRVNNSYFGRTGDWSGTFTWNPSRNVNIQNSGLGVVTGIHFNHTSFNTAADENIAITGSATTNSISISNSSLCFPGQRAAGSANIVLGNVVSTVSIQNNTIGAACESTDFGAHASANILLATGDLDNATITGNAFYGPWSLGDGPISGSTANTAKLIIKDNLFYENNIISLASNAVLEPIFYPLVSVTGAVAVTNIRHPWTSRNITFFVQDGLTFTSGGGGTDPICTTKAVAGGTMVTATFWPGLNCWGIH